MSYAQFEMSCAEAEDDESPEESADRAALAVGLARRVYDRANTALRGSSDKEERVVLLEAWRNFEMNYGDDISTEKVLQKMPRRIKRRQKVQAEDGSEEGWEEVFDYIFPEDESARPNLKLLANAKLWKKKLQETSEDASENANEGQTNEDSDTSSGESSEDDNSEDKN